MNKIKKVILSIGVFIISIISKVYAIGPDTIVSMYAVDPGPKQTVGNIVLRIGKIAIPAILFIIGLFVIFSRKITKKVKAIVVSILVIFAILGIILMNYLSTIL